MAFKNLRLPETQTNKIITIDRVQGQNRVSVLCDDVWHRGRSVLISGDCQVINGDILTLAPVLLQGVIE